MKLKLAQSCPTLWNSVGQNTGVGSLSLLQGILSTQGSNTGVPHCRPNLYHLSHKGSPRILEWVAYPSSADLPDPGIKLGSPALQADSIPTELSGKPDYLPCLAAKYVGSIPLYFYLSIKNKVFFLFITTKRV